MKDVRLIEERAQRATPPAHSKVVAKVDVCAPLSSSVFPLYLLCGAGGREGKAEGATHRQFSSWMHHCLLFCFVGVVNRRHRHSFLFFGARGPSVLSHSSLLSPPPTSFLFRCFSTLLNTGSVYASPLTGKGWHLSSTFASSVPLSVCLTEREGRPGLASPSRLLHSPPPCKRWHDHLLAQLGVPLLNCPPHLLRFSELLRDTQRGTTRSLGAKNTSLKRCIGDRKSASPMLQRFSRRSLRGYRGAQQVAALRCSLRFGMNVGGSYYQESDTAGIHQMNNDLRLGLVIKPQSTLVELWEQALKAWPTRRFLGSKMWVRGKLGYVWATYESINTEVEAMRTLLHQMGVEKGSRVVVISENRYEWVVVHFATMQLGAHFVALPTNITPSEAQLVVRSTQSKVLFVETKASYAAVKGWIGRVGQLEHAICFEDQVGEGSYAVAISIAADVPEKTPARTDVRAEDTAMIVFTAGTTGPPKGVMLSHKNIVANVSSVYASLGEALTHSDMFMSLCSWCVAGSLTADLYQALCKGACVCIPPETLEGFQDLPLVNPSVIVSVAQPFQRAYANIVDDILNRGSFTKDLTRLVVGRITENRLMFKKPGRTLRAFSHALLGKFKAQFGSELRVVIIIGHQLTKDQSELMADLDVFVVNTYGCMEAGGLIATDVDVPQRLKALPGLEVRVVNEKNEIVAPGDLGEILVEAPNAMQGYFDVHIDPEEAKNSLVEYGSRTFVRSGDYGTLTGGWITVRGNKDVLIKLANAKTVNPLEVEATLTKSPFIKQVFIYGNGRPYVVALVVANTKAIAAHLRKVERRDGIPLVNDREKADCIRAELRRVSQDLPPRTHVRRFAFVDEFTLANGFMTVKMGYARQKIEDHYVHYFEALYDETPKFYGFAVDDYDDLF